MPISLIGPLDNNHVQRVLLVAAYAGVVLKVVPITAGNENKSEAYRLNISPLARIPAMKTDEGYLSEAHAMIRYLARTEVMLVGSAGENTDHGGFAAERIPHPQYPVQYSMYGHTLLESAEVDAWLDFVAEKIDALALLFCNAEQKTGTSSLFFSSASSSGFYAGEYRRPSETDTRQLLANLGALENRLLFLRTTRKELVEQSGGALTARNFLDEEIILNSALGTDESGNVMGGGSKKDNRVSTVYNVAGSIRNKMEEKNREEKERQLQSIKDRTDQLIEEGRCSTAVNRDTLQLDFTHLNSSNTNSNSTGRPSAITPRESTAFTPRASMLQSARGPKSARGDAASTYAAAVGGSVIQRQDLLFLVGDSLTAADLSLAMALHGLYSIPSLRSEMVSQFTGVYRYYKSIMMLPVASDIRKALKISLL